MLNQFWKRNLAATLKTLFFSFCILVQFSAFAQKPKLVIPVGHTLSVLSVAISPDEKYVLTGGEDNVAILWEATSRKEIRRFVKHKSFI